MLGCTDVNSSSFKCFIILYCFLSAKTSKDISLPIFASNRFRMTGRFMAGATVV